MRSEDIAGYVAGLEAEVERLRAELATERQSVERFSVAHERTADRLRATHTDAPEGTRDWACRVPHPNALGLPDVGPVTRHPGGALTVGSTMLTDDHEYIQERADWHARCLAEYRAALAFQDAEAADTTPDTSRVTFGARHEGTGMVLLQHADLPGCWWGCSPWEIADWHRQMVHNKNVNHAAHAALAKVREALNTAEAHGVDVDDDNDASCGPWFARADDPSHSAAFRARRYLAREVQALVDQDLRGDDLNARVPYTIRDHRTPGLAALASHYGVSHSVMGTFLNGPVEAADTSSDDGVVVKPAVVIRDYLMTTGIFGLYTDEDGVQRLAEGIADALDALRAARTSEGQS